MSHKVYKFLHKNTPRANIALLLNQQIQYTR